MKINVIEKNGGKIGVPSELTDLEKVKRAVSLVVKTLNKDTLKQSFIIPSFPSLKYTLSNKVAVGGDAGTTYGNVKYPHSSYSVEFTMNVYNHSEFANGKFNSNTDESLSGSVKFEDITDSHGFQDVKIDEYKIS